MTSNYIVAIKCHSGARFYVTHAEENGATFHWDCQTSKAVEYPLAFCERLASYLREKPWIAKVDIVAIVKERR